MTIIVPVGLLILLAVIALLVVGWAVVGLAFQLLWWALIGLVIGGLARLVLPGRQDIGLGGTALGGVGGALLGGIIANAADLGRVVQFLVAIAVAAGLVALLSSRRSRQTT
jgi:uncharacterized membrane protein YeaQ/YmgE (transglycosylase-associated protein family)